MDKEKQIFDKYGNYDFPTEIKQDELNTATTQIEEMAKIMRLHICKDRPCQECDCHGLGDKTSELYHCDCYYYAESLIKQGYRKLPEDSVVRSREELEDKVIITKKEYDKLKYTFNCGYPVYKQGLEEGSKETAEKILREVLKLFPKDKQFTTISRATIYEIALKKGVEIKE